MLALPFSDSSLPENGSQIYAAMTIHSDYKKKIDAAGHFFDAFYRQKVLNQHPPEEEEKKEAQNGDDDEEGKEEEYSKEYIENMEKKRKKKLQDKLTQSIEEETHYQILGLEELGMGATEDDVKKAYRKMALKHHPDKKQQKEGEAAVSGETDPMWLKIQNAYETLTDAEKRKKYDSTLPFDESIPEGDVSEKEFFEVFKPVFQRNSLYSNKRPIPDIGKMDTNIKKVYKFYEFWEKFDSWRDFTVVDEYNLDEAENRYERRYMERENKKLKAEQYKKEKNRLFRLVENAKRNDPRLIKIRKEEEEARQKAKLERQQKKEQQKKEIEDRQKREQEAKLEEQRKKEEEEKRIEDEKKRNKEALGNAIKELKNALINKVKSQKYDKFWLQGFIDKMKRDDVVKFGEIMAKTTESNALQTLEEFVAEQKRIVEERKAQLHKQDKKINQARAEENKVQNEWSTEELSLLAKAVVKFPAGMKNRWGAMASFLGTKSADEVLAKTKELANAREKNQVTQKVNKEAYSQIQKKGIQDIGADPDKRTVYDERTVLAAAKNGSSEKNGAKEETKTSDTNGAAATNGDTASGWSQDQQQALEKALKEFPPSMEAKERWTKIAEKVPGKDKKECVARFKVLRDAIKATQAK